MPEPLDIGAPVHRVRAVSALIEAEGLTKRFRRIVAVDHVSFRIGRGEIVALLGPNGAGKTTTLRLLAGFLAPTAGTARIASLPVRDRPLPALRQVGFLPEGAPLYGEMTPRGLLRFVARLHGLTGRRGREARELVGHRLELERVLDQPIDTLSKGFRRRVALAAALLHDPAALILDEPTDGLDPNQKHGLRSVLQAMSAEKAILISTHLLEEVEALCTRVILMADGAIMLDETPEAMRARTPDGRLDTIFRALTRGEAA